MKSAAVRARELVRKVETAIEAGEFTPERGYGSAMDIRLGPCGCARTAIDFLNLGASLSLTLGEKVALEFGYEDWGRVNDCHEFFAAGRELSKFHPGYGKASG